MHNQWMSPTPIHRVAHSIRRRTLTHGSDVISRHNLRWYLSCSSSMNITSCVEYIPSHSLTSYERCVCNVRRQLVSWRSYKHTLSSKTCLQACTWHISSHRTPDLAVHDTDYDMKSYVYDSVNLRVVAYAVYDMLLWYFDCVALYVSIMLVNLTTMRSE